MKKLGLLIIGGFLLMACDATPKGNKSIMPVEYDEPVEQVKNHENHSEEAQMQNTEAKDSVNASSEIPVTEPTDSAQ